MAEPSSDDRPKTAADALAALRAGNERFARNVRSVQAMLTQARRDDLAAGQKPFAIVLSCSDSRVPAEIVFDCGLGDLFVVRVAGNVVAPSLVGSVEFAAAAFDTRLVVVLGHTGCGAIGVTLKSLRKQGELLSENVRDIVDRIAPAVAGLVEAALPEDELARAATRANVRVSVSHLRHSSRVLEQRITEGRLSIVGAEYDLQTGLVDFFDLPAASSPA
jgi:carbonic anhydrase